ncbi:MAG: membrane dipeptidase [Rhodospirillales bacterium]|nr:membrane dipeptidase [Rhodospirillales bacterium]MBO6786967.1 membrane dipeptidase [Rhodospirillales bacterium]
MDAEALHKNALVMDAAAPLLRDRRYIDHYIAGGVDVLVPTVCTNDTASQALATIAGWHAHLSRDDRLVLVSSVAEIQAAKDAGKTAVILHAQGADLLENKVDFVDAFKALGVGIMQFTYNEKNRLGDGAGERTDAGLSIFGVKVVGRCNDVGIVIDGSHTGSRTTLDAMEHSSKPVVFSHANPKGVHDTARNITDEQIKSCAATGGVIGAVGYPAFVSADPRPTIDQFIDHIAYVADLVGIEHVSLGIDYFLGQAGIADDERAIKEYEGRIAEGRWRREDYPPPPYYYPEGIETPDKLANLTAALVRRGFTETDIRAVLGGNWMRVLDVCWGK